MKPLRWAPESSFASPEEYRLHIVSYYSEVNEAAYYLRPIVEVLKNRLIIVLPSSKRARELLRIISILCRWLNGFATAYRAMQ